MNEKLNDFEIAQSLADNYSKDVTPIYSKDVYEDGTESKAVNFINGPKMLLAENEESYGLQADTIINDAIPKNTKRAYLGDIAYFGNWAIYALKSPVIPIKVTEDIVLQFIIQHLIKMPADVEEKLIQSGWKRKRGLHSLATVKRRLISVTIFHKKAGLEDPCNSKRVKDLLKAMSKNSESQKKSRAITKGVLENFIDAARGDSLIDARDRALLLFAFGSGGRRRSEVSEATIENLEETIEGDYIYNVTKSKTDQNGKGQAVPIKGRAASALREWLNASGIKEGKIFRSVSKGGDIGKELTGVDINRIVKKLCEKAGYDSSQFTAHGLRRGFITEAGKQGCSLGDVMALSGHKSIPTAMKYYESGAVLNNKAANLV